MSYDTMKKKRLDDLVWMGLNLDPEDIERERRLLTKKWFDYRFISPLEQTIRFIGEYQKRYRAGFAKHVDPERARLIDGVRLEQLYSEPAMRTQIWRARQRADETGMPYEEYLEASFTFAERRSVFEVGGKTRTRNLLSVSQLHHPNKGAAPWDDFRLDYWGQRLDMRVVQMPTAPAYRMEYFENLPAQIQFREYMIWLAKVSGSGPKGWMAHLYHLKRQIPLEEFRSVLGEAVFSYQAEALQSDVRHWGTAPESLPARSSVDMWQSCFGLQTKQDEICTTCPLFVRCAKMTELVARELRTATGSANPVRDRKLAQQRERQQKCRARKAAAPQALGATSS